MTTQELTNPQSVPVLASTVLTVVMRVAGPVPTHVHPHALGEPEQQVTARIGDAIVYLTEPTVAGRISASSGTPRNTSRRPGSPSRSRRPGWPPNPAPTPSVSRCG